MCHAVVAAGTQHSHARHVLGQLLRRFTLCSVAVVTESLRRSVCVCMYPDRIIQGPLLLKDDSSLSLFFFCISFLSCLSPTHFFSASFHCPHCPNHAFFPLSFSIAPLLSFFKSYVCSFIISHFFLNSEYYSLFVPFLHSSCH